MNYGFNIWHSILQHLTTPEKDIRKFRSDRFYEVLSLRQQLEERIEEFRTHLLARINNDLDQGDNREYSIITLLFLDQIPSSQEGYGDTVEDIRAQYEAILNKKPLKTMKHLQGTFIAVCQSLRIDHDQVDKYGHWMFCDWKF